MLLYHRRSLASLRSSGLNLRRSSRSSVAFALPKANDSEQDCISRGSVGLAEPTRSNVQGGVLPAPAPVPPHAPPRALRRALAESQSHFLQSTGDRVEPPGGRSSRPTRPCANGADASSPTRSLLSAAPRDEPQPLSLKVHVEGMTCTAKTQSALRDEPERREERERRRRRRVRAHDQRDARASLGARLLDDEGRRERAMEKGKEGYLGKLGGGKGYRERRARRGRRRARGRKARDEAGRASVRSVREGRGEVERTKEAMRQGNGERERARRGGFPSARATMFSTAAGCRRSRPGRATSCRCATSACGAGRATPSACRPRRWRRGWARASTSRRGGGRRSRTLARAPAGSRLRARDEV